MRKISLFFGVLVILVSVFVVAPQAKALTVEELTTLIANLQKQLADLQKQLTEKENASIAWCHDFTSSIQFGDTGSEVLALQTALGKAGFPIMDIVENGQGQNSFGEFTAASVVGFQEKYASDILAPLGLKHGTGVAGKATRLKLTGLYGCGQTILSAKETAQQLNNLILQAVDLRSKNDLRLASTLTQARSVSKTLQSKVTGTVLDLAKQLDNLILQAIDLNSKNDPQLDAVLAQAIALSNALSSKLNTPSVTVISPNGGEMLQEGSNHKITWNVANLPNDAKIYITLFRSDGENMSIISNLPATQREYAWWVTGSGDWGLGYEYKPSLFARILGIKEVEAAGIGYQIMVSAMWGTYGTNYYGNIYDKSNDWFNIAVKSTPSITVTSPNGGDALTAGKNFSVTWKQNGLNDKTFAIYLVGYDSAGNSIYAKSGYQVAGSVSKEYFIQEIPATTKTAQGLSAGEYGVNWAIPSDIASRFESAPSSYKLGVWSRTTGVVDTSDKYFSIVASNTSYLNVTSPASGEQWAKGSTQTIRWNTNDTTDQVTIYSTTVGSNNTNAIVWSTKNSGSYSWYVNTPGTEIGPYQIKVCTSSGNSAVQYTCGQSSTFYIVAAATTTPSITVTSPNGGEQWVSGNTYDITWNSVGIGAVNIELQNSTSFQEWHLAYNLPASQRKYSWKIPSSIPIGSFNEISIWDASSLIKAEDSSDNYFSIAAPTASSKSLMFDVNGIKATYLPGEKISLFITASEYGGVLASPSKGFNVQSYIFNSARTKTYAGVNGVYDSNTGLWKVVLTAPTDSSLIYDLKISLYCAVAGSECMSKYGADNQIDQTYVFTLTSGALSIVADPATPPSLGVIMGTSNNVFTKVKFSATGETIKIKKIKITREGGTDADFGSIKLYDGTTLLNAAYLVSGAAVFNFPSGSELKIPKDSPRVVTVKADVADYLSAHSGDAVRFNINNSADVSAVGEASALTINPSGTAIGNEMYLFRALPVVSLSALSPSGVQVPSVNKEVFRFDVKNTGSASDLTIRQIKFGVDAVDSSGIEGKQFKLYKSTDLASEINSGSVINGDINMLWPAGVVIPDGSTVTLVLKGDVSAVSGNLMVSIEAGDFYWNDNSGENTNKAVKDLPVRGGTLSFPAVARPSVTVLSPNGGEKWVANGAYSVKWASQNIPNSASVVIDFQKSGSVKKQYIEPNDGSLDIEALNLPIGDDYKVNIYYGEAEDFSDNYFSMIEAASSSCVYLQQGLTSHYLGSCGSAKYDPVFDFNKDKIINALDNSLIIANQNNETWCSAMKVASTSPCATTTSVSDRERQLASISDALEELMAKIRGFLR